MPDDSDNCSLKTPSDAVARYNERIPAAIARGAVRDVRPLGFQTGIAHRVGFSKFHRSVPAVNAPWAVTSPTSRCVSPTCVPLSECRITAPTPPLIRAS